jgi:hypothetical protein
MKSTALIFALVEPADANAERKLRECLAALELEARMNRTEKPAQDPNPFWTWFIDNPRPQSPK